MQCDICFRTGSHKLPFLCPTHARNQLYEGRIQNAQVLLENESLQKEVEARIADSEAEATPASRLAVDAMLAEKDETVDRTQQIIAHADELREKVEQAKEEVAKKKADLASRRVALNTASSGLEARRARLLEDVEKSSRMTKFNWNKVHDSHVSSKTYLSGEAAKLYGLRKTKSNTGQEEYKIGRVGITDIRALNTASPAQISTSLSHIVHLLVLSMHYLAIRLPAEITLPHRDYPLPTIFPLTSSYTYIDVPFPGNITGQTSNTSPSASRHAEQVNLPRPRPLFISKPLPILAAEDPVSYGRFLEGVTLLAYNIAWACKSQGVPVGEDSSFDDICNIGRNLYNLLIGPKPHSTPTTRVPSRYPTPTKGGNRESEAEGRKIPTDALMGRYSHGTAHSFLGSAEGTEFIRSWKLPNPMKLADKLKARLMSEVANAEWEVLDQDAWTVDDEMGDDGVVVGARKERGGERATNLGMQSFMSMRTVIDAVEMVAGDGDKKPGTSGWTKLKPR